jgi:hypothetical protein
MIQLIAIGLMIVLSNSGRDSEVFDEFFFGGQTRRLSLGGVYKWDHHP